MKKTLDANNANSRAVASCRVVFAGYARRKRESIKCTFSSRAWNGSCRREQFGPRSAESSQRIVVVQTVQIAHKQRPLLSIALMRSTSWEPNPSRARVRIVRKVVRSPTTGISRGFRGVYLGPNRWKSKKRSYQPRNVLISLFVHCTFHRNYRVVSGRSSSPAYPVLLPMSTPPRHPSVGRCRNVSWRVSFVVHRSVHDTFAVFLFSCQLAAL